MPTQLAHRPQWRVGPILLLASWVTCLGCGFVLALGHATRPGASASAPARMTAHAPGKSASSLYRLLVFVHPQCPCTRSTIEELDRIAARAGSHARICAYFLSDPDQPDTWTKSATWRAATWIPGVEVLTDPRGETARAFGARTSGETLLYSPAGDLVYHGGITGARGHAGDNIGADAIVAALLGDPSPVKTTPVYGCALFDDEPQSAGAGARASLPSAQVTSRP